ncbi:hypothetical protein YW3DRAFT_05852 [Streptomyces sp. MnatMP-M77]|nr:hypothetical protein YW3DRAFT_05852 [Streptomyces sp. MnatMP-M77]
MSSLVDILLYSQGFGFSVWRLVGAVPCLALIALVTVWVALVIDVMRLGLHRDLRKIRQDFRFATPRSTGARAATSARLRVFSVGVSSWSGLRLIPVVGHGPAPW